MKITIEKIAASEEDEVIIRCHHVNAKMMEAIAVLEAQNTMLTAFDDKEIIRINPEIVLYVESVDKKTFLYCQNKVYESRSKLHELEDVLKRCDFFRASKAVLVNLAMVQSFAPAAAGRFEAVMKSGERIIITRHYVNELKSLLSI